MEVEIRFATHDDFAATERIEAEADRLLVDALRAEEWPAGSPGTQRESTPGFTLVGIDSESGRLAGFAYVVEYIYIAHLEQLSVLPEFGRRGLGRKLVEATCTEARRRGYGAITLNTYADVPWNAPFYASCGFFESDPVTDFHRRLLASEDALGLARYGRRVLMTRTL